MLFRVVYYKANNGSCPMRAFLADLEVSHPLLHKKTLSGLEKLKDQRHHRPPHTKLVDPKNRIYELRIKSKSDLVRAFFFIELDKVVVVTNGYVKKQQKLDQGALDRAIRFKADREGGRT